MITLDEYKKRRQKLAQKLPENSLAILASCSEKLRNGDAHYRFRQASNFYYLTGFNEPNAVLLIIAGKEGDSFLFNNVKDPKAEVWTGKRLGQEAACQTLGVKEAYPIEELDKRLAEFLSNRSAIYYSLGEEALLDSKIMAALQIMKGQIRRGVHAPPSLCDIDTILGEMRLYKSPAEIALMRKSAEISVEAHLRAMRVTKIMQWEYQLEAELLYEFLRQGCRSVAYDPIVAAGKNACILHYTSNNAPLTPGDLLLIDAGGEFENYAADITRTFPINGCFTKAQRDIYELVLQAQKAGIACIKPGVPFALIQQTMLSILTQGLIDLGLLQGKLDTLLETRAYSPFYMHNSGHWLGLDVHDTGHYVVQNTSRNLEPGMVLTVEPGLYISADIPGVPQVFQNIGIRIEDDILVTEKGYENLTQALPVDADEIEAILQ